MTLQEGAYFRLSQVWFRRGVSSHSPCGTSWMEMVGEMMMVDVGLNDQVRVRAALRLASWGRGFEGGSLTPPALRDAQHLCARSASVGSQGAGPARVPEPLPVLGRSSRTLRATAVRMEAASLKCHLHSWWGAASVS